MPDEPAPKTILVMDDDEELLMLLASRLTFSGYRVIEAKDGEEGVEKIQECKPDLIILDVFMPNMNGHQVWTFLKRNPEFEKIPVLVLSAQFPSSDKFWGKSLPAEDYIMKPYDSNKIVEIIRKKLGA